jgi:hypothetical protein
MRGYGNVRWDFSRADRVPETALHQRRAARDRALQEPLNLSVVHKRRKAHHKAAPGGPFLGNTFDASPFGAARTRKDLFRIELDGERGVIRVKEGDYLIAAKQLREDIRKPMELICRP